MGAFLSFRMDHMWESARLEAMRLGDMEFRREEVEEAHSETLSATATGTEQITEPLTAAWIQRAKLRAAVGHPIISVSKGATQLLGGLQQCATWGTSLGLLIIAASPLGIAMVLRGRP